MTNQTTMLREIIEEHSDRIKNMKKYYPYFRLAETSLAQYRDGMFADLDMGYITLAVIRFFIEENNFNKKEKINILYLFHPDNNLYFLNHHIYISMLNLYFYLYNDCFHQRKPLKLDYLMLHYIRSFSF